ncbi:MAG: hypothetical protein GY937_08575 [bacterium]|nr:hypothetical protein [bacterium]
MLDRIGWLFAGSQRLFPNRGYLGTFGGQATTYFAYQEQLDQHRSLAPDFFSLSRVNCSKNVVRCSSGLLLAALVGPQAAGAEVTRLVDSSAELSAEVPDILIHSITLAAALSRDTETVLGLVPLLNRASSEESREDVICALALYSSPAAVAAITAFVEAQLPASQDNAVQTGLAAAKLRLDSDEFEAWQGRLRASLNSERKEVLDDIGARGFLPPMLSSEPLVKLWDGIGTVIYDDGMQLLHPSGFSYFRGR